jgi:hypothetical protein
MKRFLSIALAAALLLSAIPAHAQTPPPKPVVVQIGATQQAQAANVEVGPNKLRDFRTGLRSDSRYPVWLGQANALVGNTYHVQVEYTDANGATVSIPSTVVIVVVGLIILTFIVPEITLPEAGMWMMTGALVPN